MDKDLKDRNLKAGAKISLIVLLISIVLQLLSFFQTTYVLTSPIISEKVILDIVEPFILNALISTIICIIALIFFYYSKYLFTILVCGLGLIWQQVYHYF
jgi:hypothetical protein